MVINYYVIPGNWIIVTISVALLLLSLFLIIYIIRGKYRTNREEISSISKSFKILLYFRNVFLFLNFSIYIKTREFYGKTGIKPIPNIPEIRRIIRKSPVRNPFPNHRGVEEYKITPYSISFEFNKTRQSSEIQSNERPDKSMTTFEEISEYAVIDSDYPVVNYEKLTGIQWRFAKSLWICSKLTYFY